MKQLMTGNEAIARGIYEAGIMVAAAYPGTPSTEILENCAKYKEIYSEWSVNEKVALEVAIGAAIAGVPALAAMKHVGVNVAADPLFTAAYTGVEAGLVLVSADDPGMHSSQNEQDNRYYARAAKVPMLEPSDSQEAKDFVAEALRISRELKIPVMLRLTTRICHSKSPVTLGEREKPGVVEYKKNPASYVAAPANSRKLRVQLEDKLCRLRDISHRSPLNRVERGEKQLGIVASGVAYQYAREALGDRASYLKLGITNPLPIELIREFAAGVDRLVVVEELDGFIEEQLKAAGIPCVGKEMIPGIGELTPEAVSEALSPTDRADASSPLPGGEDSLVGRPPAMCTGCPHRGAFYALSKRKGIMVTGDIGCYTLGAAPPLASMDTCICMGASISAGHGAAKAFELTSADMRVVSVIGDSTFFHSGITGLVNAVYNKGNYVTMILDNRTTGMTGHQENPGTGYTLMGDPTPVVDFETLCRALGIDAIFSVNPMEPASVEKALDMAIEHDGPAVIIVRWPCVLKTLHEEEKEEFPFGEVDYEIVEDLCKGCRICVKLGCPALSVDRKVHIDRELCRQCGVCSQVCRFGAIVKAGVDR